MPDLIAILQSAFLGLLYLIGCILFIRLFCEVLVLLEQESPDRINQLPKSERPLRVYGRILWRGLILLAPFITLLAALAWIYF